MRVGEQNSQNIGYVVCVACETVFDYWLKTNNPVVWKDIGLGGDIRAIADCVNNEDTQYDCVVSNGCQGKV
jgi:hypothetical protein